MKKIVLTLCAALASSFILSACNTVNGAGKDIERGGEKVQDAAQKTKEKM